MYHILRYLQYTESFLEEISPDDSEEIKEERAKLAKLPLEKAGKRLDRLYNRNPGFTARCRELRRLSQIYTDYDLQIKTILGEPYKITDSVLFRVLSEAEEAVMRARDRIGDANKAKELLEEAEMLFTAIQKQGHEIPDTFKQRLDAILGYGSQL